MMFRFCPQCASGLDNRRDGTHLRRCCPQCGFVQYRNPVPAAGGIVCRDGAVCLVRRAVEPRKGYWSLPAGFMEYDETARGCAERELCEEIGLRLRAGDLLGVYSGFDDPRQHAVLIVFWMDDDTHDELRAGDDADEVGLFTPNSVPDNIAFLAHREALRDVFAHPRFELDAARRGQIPFA